MIKYLFVILCICGFSFSDFYPKYRKVILFFIWILLSVIAGLRTAGGVDYEEYYYAYNSPFYGHWESGYVFIENIGHVIGLNYNVFQFVITAFSLYILLWFIKKYSKYPILSLSFYLGTYFLYYNMVLNRQMLAVAFALLAFDCLLQRRHFLFFGYVILGFFFHVSILIFIPFFFIYKYLILKRWTILAFAGLTIFLFMVPLEDWIAQGAEMQVLNKGIGYFQSDNFQVNTFEYLKIFLILLLFFIYRKYLNASQYRIYILSFLCFSSLLISFSRFEILVRVSMYFDLLTMLFIPLFISRLRKELLLPAYIACMLIFSFFFLYRISKFAEGEFLSSNLYFLSDIF